MTFWLHALSTDIATFVAVEERAGLEIDTGKVGRRKGTERRRIVLRVSAFRKPRSPNETCACAAGS